MANHSHRLALSALSIGAGCALIAWNMLDTGWGDGRMFVGGLLVFFGGVGFTLALSDWLKWESR